MTKDKDLIVLNDELNRNEGFERVKDFLSENKMLIASIGGCLVGITIGIKIGSKAGANRIIRLNPYVITFKSDKAHQKAIKALSKNGFKIIE